MKRSLFFLLALAACSVLHAQTVGQIGVSKWTSSGLRTTWITPVNSRAIGVDSSGNLSMVTTGGGTGLDNIASSLTGDTLTFTGTLTAGRLITWRDVAGTVALTSDLSGYASLSGSYANPSWISSLAWSKISSAPDFITAATAASTYAPLNSPSFGGNVSVAAGSVTALNFRPSHEALLFVHSSAAGEVTSKLIVDENNGAERDAVTWSLRHNVGGTIAVLTDLNSLNASNLTSGTVSPARLGSGTSISTKYLRGDGTWQTISGGGDAQTSASLDQFADVTQSAGKTLSITDNTTLNGGTHSGTNTGDQTTITGNAGTATALQTARNINGVAFDGTANITVTAAAGTLSGSTLASGVTGSSLTGLGIVASGTWQATPIADSYIASASTWNAKESALTFSTGLTRSVNTVTVNTTQSITKLSNLTTNGFVKTSGGDGTLSVDTSTYLTSASALNADNISSGTVPPARLGSGTSITTKYLRGDGTWQTVSSGGGSAPQPLQAQLTSTFSTTSSSFTTVTGLSQAYTPSSTTQKVLVRCVIYLSVSVNSTFAVARLTRDGSAIGVGDTAGSRTRAGGAAYDNSVTAWVTPIVIEWLDTPGTTSSVTYAVETRNTDGSSTVWVNRAGTDADLAIYPRTVSTLTVIPFAE